MNDEADEDGTRDEDGSDDQLAWTTDESRVAYECPGFDVVHDEVTLPDGTRTDYDYVDEPNAVVVLPFTPDGDVVVIEEWRQAVGRVNRGLPAGSVEPDDDDLTLAARRELREETGYEAGRLERTTTVEPSNGIANSVHHHFVAYDCEPTAEQDLDHDEQIRVATAAYGELLDAIRDGGLLDGRAVTGLLFFDRFCDEPPTNGE